jgi:serine/threonine-protein kinase/endoribonuclease IRE1
MPPAEDVLYQLATGLVYIHKVGLIHRNLKPQNVLIWVDPSGKKILLKWTDFGLSKASNERGSYTMTAEVKRTWGWFAPEVLEIMEKEEESQEDVGARKKETMQSDVFAEGLIFGYYLLDGFHPYGPRYEIQKNILEDKPVNLKSNSHLLKH